MAKPIRSTPTLVGEEANKFLERMIVVENSPISKTDKELAEQIKANSRFFKILAR